MTKIDFYVYSVEKQIESVACLLAAKAYNKQIPVYIHTNSIEQTNSVDQLLWEFKPESFIPHETIDNFNSKNPIHIGNEQTINTNLKTNMLINLADKTPTFFSKFIRMAEIIVPNNKVKGRLRYKFYQDRGYPLNTYKL